MNILVINVSLRPQSAVKLFPVGLGYITTAMKRAGFVFDLLDIDGHRYTDQEVENKIRNKRYDIVCLGCIVTGYRIVKYLSSLIKSYHPYAIIIAGNSVASSITETILSHTNVDIAVIGEGDETIVDLLIAITHSKPLDEVRGICFMKSGVLVKTPTRPLIKNISELPFIDFSIFDVEEYIKTSQYALADPLPFPRSEARALPINTARGCIANCNFCYHVFKGMMYRFRSPESLTNDIKRMINQYNLNYIQFWDELTFFSKKQVKGFISKIREENLEFFWHADCRANLFQSENDITLLSEMKAAGCLGLGYSLESADPEILRAMNKQITVEQFSKQTRLLRRAGLATFTSLVLGYPQETPETIRKTFDCCIENEIYPSPGYLLPQPGSPVYDYALQHGYIVDEEEYLMKMGDRQELTVNMTIMADDEFIDHVSQGLARINEALNIGLANHELIKTQYFRSKK